MAQTEAATVRKQVVVDTPIERAFTVFTGSASGSRAWWTGTWTARPTAPYHRPWAQNA